MLIVLVIRSEDTAALHASVARSTARPGHSGQSMQLGTWVTRGGYAQ